MKVLYVTGTNVEGPDATTEQLTRLSPDLKITTVASAAQALEETRGAGGFRALLTSPWLAHNDTLALIVSLRRDRVPIAIVPVLTETQRDFFASAVAAGADDVLLLRGETLLRANETLTRIRQSPHLSRANERRRLRVLYAGTDERVWALLEQVPFVTAERATTGQDGSCSVRSPGAGDHVLRCDAVIIDQQAGQAHPLQVLKSVKNQASDLPVIVLSPPGAGDVETAALDLGADDTVVKSGIYRRRLIATLRRVHQRFEIVAQHQLLKAREARLREIVETLPQGIGVVGEDFTVLAMNAVALELLGASKPTDVVGRDFRAFIDSDHRDAVATALRGIETSGPLSIRCDLIGDDGGRRAVEVAGAPLERDARGGRGMVVVFREPEDEPPADTHELEATRASLAAADRIAAERDAAHEAELAALRAGWESARQSLEKTLEEAQADAARRGDAEAALADALTHERGAWDETRRTLEARVEEARSAAERHGADAEAMTALERALEHSREELRQAVEAAGAATEAQHAAIEAARAEHLRALLDLQAEQREWTTTRAAFESDQRDWATTREGFDAERHEWAATREALDAERREWEATREALERDRAEARASADALDANVRDAETARHTATERAAKIEADVDALRDALRSAESARSELEQSVAANAAAYAAWTSREQELASQLEGGRRQAEAAEHRVRDLADTTQALERALAQRSETIDHLGRDVDAARQAATDLDARLRESNEARQVLETRAAAAEAAAAMAAAARRQDFDEALERLQHELQQRAEDHATERGVWEAMCQDFEARLNDQDAVRRSLEAGNDELRADADRLDALRIRAETDRARLEDDRARLGAEQARLESVAHAGSTRTEQLESEVRLANERAERHESEARAVAGRVAELESATRAASDRAAQLEAEARTAHERTARLEAETRAAHERAAQLESDGRAAFERAERLEEARGDIERRMAQAEAERESAALVRATSEDARRQAEDARRQLEERLAQADERSAQAAAANAGLERQLEHLAAERRDLAAKLSEALKHQEALDQERESVAVRLRSAAEAARAHETVTATLATLRADHAATAGALDMERAARAADRAEIEVVRQAFDHERSRRAALREQLRELERETEDRRAKAETEAAARRGLEHQLDEAVRERDGRTAEAEARIRALRDELDELRWNRSQLAQSPLLGRALVSRDGKLVECNDTFAKIFGFADAADAVARRFAGLAAGPDHVSPEPRIAGKPAVFADVTLSRIDGQPVKVRETSSLVTRPDGTTLVERLVVDLSDTLRVERELRQARRLEEVGTMAASMAPDVEAQLREVAAAGAELRRAIPSVDPRRAAVDTVVARADRAAGLLRQLVTFNERQMRPLVTVPLSEAVTRAEGTLRGLVGPHVQIRFDPRPSGVVTENQGDLDQLLTALVVVARDLLPMGGSLVVETDLVDLSADDTKGLAGAVSGRHAVVAVTAAGYGLQPAQIAPSAEVLAQRCGGCLRVENDADRSASIEVYFPSAQ